MPSGADTTIDALRAVHGELTARVAGLSDADLERPSAATEWSVADVLSHVGSGAEITHAGLAAALAGSEAPGQSFNESVWARWNAMTPREQADGCLRADEEVVSAYEALDDATRDSLRLPLGFLPEPVSVELAGALRLNEAALHCWDVAVADDTSATVNSAAVPVLLSAMSGPLAWLIGVTAKGAGTDAVLAVHTVDPPMDLTLQLGERVSLRQGPAEAPDGTVTLPAEALMRLISGRLRPELTPVGVEVTGPVDLDSLRAVFPGY